MDDASRRNAKGSGDDAVRPGRYVDRYKVLFPLGQGGRGHVFAAHDPHLDRKVALKVLKRRGAEGCDELVAEAQNIARLAHPNIVEVLAVGEHAGRLFMAMEFIEGLTLAQWLRRDRRSWTEIVDVFIDAGRGLEAAHAAGFVHRDFKPHNVMVGRDGRIRVLDFGMALERTQMGTVSESSRKSGRGKFSGTVAYMAPEQFLGEPLDGRTDLFAFCISLYEALWGHGPFAGSGDSVRERAQAVIAGKVRPPPRRGPVPARLRRAVMRGLHRDPNRRWPTMAALLQQLIKAREGEQHVRWPAYAASVFAVLASVALPVVTDGAETGCDPDTALGHPILDVERGARLRGVLEQRGGSPASAQRIMQKLEGHVTAWESRYRELCGASEYDVELAFDHEMTCLRRHGVELDAVIGALSSAQQIDPVATTESLAQLSSVAGCASAQTAARFAVSPEVERSVSLVKAYINTAQFPRALELARATHRSASSSNDARSVPATLFWLGVAQFQSGDYETAAQTLARAHWEAVAAGDDRTAALAAVQVLGVLVSRIGDLERASAWSRHARAAVRRIPLERTLRAELLERQALLAQDLGQTEHARHGFEAAIAELGKAREHQSIQMARVLNNYGLFLEREGHLAQAFAKQREALRLKRKHVGRDHPLLTTTMINLASLSRRMGEPESARALLDEARRIREKIYGAEHLAVAVVLAERGSLEVELGRCMQARPILERARALLEAEEHRAGALDEILLSLARCELRALRLEQARGLSRRALELRRQQYGTNDASLMEVYIVLGSTASAGGEFEDAQAWYERALQLLEAKTPLHPDGVALFEGLAQLQVAEGRHELALDSYERALRIANHHELDPIAIARLELALASVFAIRPAGEQRARKLVQDVLAHPRPHDERWHEVERSARSSLGRRGR